MARLTWEEIKRFATPGIDGTYNIYVDRVSDLEGSDYLEIYQDADPKYTVDTLEEAIRLSKQLSNKDVVVECYGDDLIFVLEEGSLTPSIPC